MGPELVLQTNDAAITSAFVQVIVLCCLAFNAMIQLINTVVLGVVYVWLRHVYIPQTPTRCTCMIVGVVASVAVTAATLLTGAVYLQKDMLLVPGQAWVFPVTVGLTIPSILTPLFLRCFRPMLGIVECTVDAVVFALSRIVEILLMLWYIKDSHKGRVALGITVGFAVLSACGLGYCLVFSVVFLLPKRVLKRTRKFAGYYNYSIPYNSFGGGSNNSGLPSRCAESTRSAHGSTSHASTNKRPREGTDGNEGSEYPGSPPRKGRKKEFHDGDPCGPCTIWTMTGCDERGREKHKHQPIMRHPMDKAPEFSSYLSCEGVEIVLQPDSCLCDACYRDCMRKTDKPRWVSIQSSLIKSDKHCLLCCSQESCPCADISDWGPMRWFEDDTLQLWTEYF